MTRWWVEKIFRLYKINRNNQILPGRWQIKKDTENWMTNYHPEPGYDNNLKDIWVKSQNLKKIKQ